MANKIRFLAEDGTITFIDNPSKIERCCLCKGLLVTGFRYPDNKPYHGNCYDTVRQSVEKTLHQLWLQKYRHLFPRAFITSPVDEL